MIPQPNNEIIINPKPNKENRDIPNIDVFNGELIYKTIFWYIVQVFPET